MNVYEKPRGGACYCNQDLLQACAPFHAPIIDLVPFREQNTSASQEPEDVKFPHAAGGGESLAGI
jgi:hypothetical protein